MEFSRPEYWSGLPCFPPGESSLPRDQIQVKSRSPALQADALPSELPGKPKNTGVGSLSLSPMDLPDPGVELGSLALQVDSLLTEPQGKPIGSWWWPHNSVNVLNISRLHTLKGWILWHVKHISGRLLLQKLLQKRENWRYYQKVHFSNLNSQISVSSTVQTKLSFSSTKVLRTRPD